MILTKTYREQNQYIMQIMRLIYIGESKKARKHLFNINMQYAPALDHMISLGSYNQNLKEKVSNLQEQVDRLTKELKIANRDEEEIKYNALIKMNQTSSDSNKIKIFNLLESEDFNEIQRIAKDQKFTKFGKILQQAWEYRWILDKYDQLMNMKNQSSINKFRELTFQKDRKWLQSFLLGTSTTIVDINKEFTKILQTFDTNVNINIDPQKTLIHRVNKNLLLRIHQNQQMMKSQLMKKCQNLGDIENRIKQVYRRFGKFITTNDYTCADMVYNLAIDYEQLKYDFEQSNILSKLDKKKPAEEKIGLIQFKYWFDWFIDVIKINNLMNVRISSQLCEKEMYREKFECIRQIIFQAIQRKNQGISVSDKQTTDIIMNAKNQLQCFNQKLIMSLKQPDKIGVLLDLSKKDYLQENIRIVGENISIVLHELQFYRQQYMSLSQFKNKSIIEKWQQQEQQEQSNCKSQKSQKQQSEIENKLKIEMSQLKKNHEDSKEHLLKEIAEKQTLITGLKKKNENLNAQIQPKTNKVKQKQNHQSKAISQIKTLQKSIFISQILVDDDFDIEQNDAQQHLADSTLQNQKLKVQIAEKDKVIADLIKLNQTQLKKMQEKYERKIEEWQRRCKQYQADYIQYYEMIKVISKLNNNEMFMNDRYSLNSENSNSLNKNQSLRNLLIYSQMIKKQEELKQQNNSKKVPKSDQVKTLFVNQKSKTAQKINDQ